MAKRPAFGKPVEPQLTSDELVQLERNLSHLSPHHLRVMYEQTFQECRLPSEGLPPPKSIQTLVQIWKQLRRATRPPR